MSRKRHKATLVEDDASTKDAALAFLRRRCSDLETERNRIERQRDEALSDLRELKYLYKHAMEFREELVTYIEKLEADRDDV